MPSKRQKMKLFALIIFFGLGVFSNVSVLADHDKNKRPILRARLGEDRQVIAPLNAITQAQLKFLGYYSGRIDNDFGANSKAALKRFQSANGLRSAGILNRSSIRKLEKRVDQKTRKLSGLHLDGNWSRFKNCNGQLIEVRGNILIKRHKGRLSVPRLDFLRSEDDVFYRMIAKDKLIFVDQNSSQQRKAQNGLIPKLKPAETNPTRLYKCS